MSGQLRYADMPTTEVDAWIDAEPERVWPHVIGLQAMVSASAELQACAWLDEPGPGARFSGTNHREDMGEWTTTCVVTEWVPMARFGWDVHDSAERFGAHGAPIASWAFSLAAENDGTRLTQWVRMGPGLSGVSQVIAARPEMESRIVTHRLREFGNGMRANLEEIARRARA